MVASILLLLILFCCTGDQSDYLYNKKKLTDVVKYIAALVVVIGHAFLFYIPDFGYNYEFVLGDLSVSIFFFLSGYGLIYNVSRKKDYLKNFLKNRFSKLLIPFFLAVLLYLLVSFLLGETFMFSEVLSGIISKKPFLPYSWYVLEILALYLLFYFCFKFLKPRYALVLLSFLIITMMSILYCNGMRKCWIMSTPCFLMGIFYYRYETNILSFYTKNRFILFLVLCLFLVSFEASPIVRTFHIDHFYEIALYLKDSLFMIVFAYVLSFFSKELPFNNKMIQCSYELYLNQGSVFSIVKHLTSNNAIFLILSLFLCNVVGYLMNLLSRKVSN